ncbi:hypothetical protein J7U46_08775 [Pelomonas sp. V22]|uniref:hypothetical protein n=1 Tax=Pelomonas sp. V22 TaxID=2822139 RepID=UPI0024A9A977|nr:hypothetical protein [Pelomonas sp. V22]MDI4633137.1 hypothetical protein [Pelomonas sp. V22]
MTSEVLMLNKEAVVIAADSAVTTGRAPHPRYSKAANKIFDVSAYGNVALTIYGSADIDRVPWELVAKLFRVQDAASPQRPKLADYQGALLSYLQCNASVFPQPLRDDLLTKRLFAAAVYVLGEIERFHPIFIDQGATEVDRRAAWTAGATKVDAELSQESLASPLTAGDYLAAQTASNAMQADLADELAADERWKYSDAALLRQLACEALVKRPADFLPSTGVVLAGYGAEEIFPSFSHIRLYGHIAGTLFWKSENSYAITHDNAAWIQPFAQSSMIERFTDGFDTTLTAINHGCSSRLIDNIFDDIKAAGTALPGALEQSVRAKRHAEFLKDFKQRNWDENFYPLRRVLNSLSVSEMGHLAESLLVLEALRERVTSPSESVGGPIDVAVVTKAEGLVWLKRKHFFEPDLNLRYVNRMKA